jgi:molybdenum cofactor biosynthesis enzyme MoaA
VPLTRISLELTNLCRKGCAFCYNASDPRGATTWTDDEIVALAEDCARHGVTAISFGGGEPLEYPGLFNVLTRLRGVLARTLTTHGLLLDPPTIDRLVAVAPEKIHLSIHQPARLPEVHRVLASVHELAARQQPDLDQPLRQVLVGRDRLRVVIRVVRASRTPAAT